MSKPQGIRDGRCSCCGSLTRSLGAMSKLATGSVGSRHSSTGSSNRHHEARNPAHRYCRAQHHCNPGRMWLPQRVCCLAVGWFRHGLLLRRGPAQPASGRGRSRAGSTSFRERTFTCWLNQLEGRKLVEPTCSLPEEHPLGFTPQLLGFRHVCTLGGLAFQDCQEFRGAS